MRISVVTPLYKSAPYIEELYRRSVAAIGATGASGYEIVFVNDGSPDESLAIAKRLAEVDSNVVVIDLARNFGQHKAIMAGLAHTTGDRVFILDSDLEEEPEWLVRFFTEMTSHHCDVVYGVNNNIKRGLFYSACRRIFYKTLNFVSAIKFPENVCAARLMSRRYVDALLQFKEADLFFVGICHVVGFTQLPIEVVKADSSPSSYSAARLVALFINGITSFSIRPLMIISISGIGLSMVAFAYIGLIIYQKMVLGVSIPGWASTMAATLLIGGVTLFFNGIMAIYLAKIFIEVKQRPRTIIKDVHNSTPGNSRGEAKHLDGAA